MNDRLAKLRAQAAQQPVQADQDAAAFRARAQALFPEALRLRDAAYAQLDAVLQARGYAPLDRRYFRLTENGHQLAPYVKGRKADGSPAIGYKIRELP